MMKRHPLIYRFKVDDALFVYDAGTSLIFQIDDVVYDLLEGLGGSKEGEIKARCEVEFDSTRVALALDEIQTARKLYCCFSEQRPQIGLHVSADYLREKIATETSSIALEVTQDCNLRCTYCVSSGGYEGNRRHSNTYMALEVAKRAVDFLAKHCCGLQEKWLAISFYGREPLLNFSLIKKVAEYAPTLLPHERLIYTMTTNLTLLDLQKLKSLVDNEVALFVSLDGPPEVHDRCRRYKGSFGGTHSQVIRSLELIREKYPRYYREKVYLNATLSHPLDWQVLREYFLKELKLDFDKVNLSAVRPGNDNYVTSVVADRLRESGRLGLEAEFREKIQTAGAQSRGAKNNNKANSLTVRLWDNVLTYRLFSLPLIKFHRRHSARGWPMHPIIHAGPCLPGTRKLFISATGEIYPCERGPNSPLFQIGHITRGVDYAKAYALIHDYIQLAADHCANCWAVHLCGQCPAKAFQHGRLSKERKLQNCATQKRKLDYVLKLYCWTMMQNPTFFDSYPNLTIS